MKGILEVITGCMYSGKTEELLRRIRRVLIAKQEVKVFKPSIDDRYAQETIISHDKNKTPSNLSVQLIKPSDPESILDKIDEDTQVVGIEEVQFFLKKIVGVINCLVEKGIRVIVSGLDLDFKAEPFGSMPEILALADEVGKLKAICLKCGKEATRTQRMINNKPAEYFSEVILVGGEEFYTAVCANHHEVSGKPSSCSDSTRT